MESEETLTEKTQEEQTISDEAAKAEEAAERPPENKNPLETTSIGRLILRYSLPAIL